MAKLWPFFYQHVKNGNQNEETFDLDGSLSFISQFRQWYRSNGNLMVSNNILSLFCRLIKFCFITFYTKVCISKATIVAYAFLVQYFESATRVAYVGLRVKVKNKYQLIKLHHFLLSLIVYKNYLKIMNLKEQCVSIVYPCEAI